MLIPHFLIQIHPGRIDSLAPYILSLIKHVIEDLYAEMTHAYLIDIGKADGKTNVHLIPVLKYRIYLIPDIAFRFFY